MPSDRLQNAFQTLVFTLFLTIPFSLGFMLPMVSIGPSLLTPTELVFPLFFLSWFFALITGALPFRWRAEYGAFALYVVVMAVASVFSMNPSLSFTKLAGVVYLALLALATASVITTLTRLRRAFVTWIIGAATSILIACLAIVLFYIAPQSEILDPFLYHYGAVPAGHFPRINSTFITPSMFCNYLTVTLTIVLAAASREWIGRKTTAVLVAGIFVAAVFTFSIALGGMFLALGLWVWSMNSFGFLNRVASTILIAVALGFVAIAPISLSSLSTAAVEPSSRLLVWKDAFATFAASPLTGKGPGTGAASVAFQNTDGTWSMLTDAHNMFLNVAAESGLLGLIGLLAVILFMLKTALSNRSESPRPALAIAFIAAFLFDGLTGSYEDARYLWVLIGLIVASPEVEEQ